MKKSKLVVAFIAAVLLASGVPASTFAANNSTFNQTINTAALDVNILNASQIPVASPAVAMSPKGFLFTCQSGGDASTGTFGTNSERIYVFNPDAADNGWTLTLGATAGTTATWTSGGNSFDFNDDEDDGCTDGADADAVPGQLTVDPSAGTITTDCDACTSTNITKGSSASFVEGATDSITLITATSGSDDVWRGYLTGVGLSQTIPAETPAGSYTINMTLTATAS